MKKARFIRICSVVVALFWAASLQAAELKVGDDKNFIKFGMLLQGWAAFENEGAPDKKSLDTDFYLRRIRLLFSGQLNENILFFVETDNPNLGKKGDFSGRTYIQDAWLELKFSPALLLDVGMLLMPFSHNLMQGAGSLHAIDYHTSFMKYPTGSNLGWRDMGLMLRGLMLGDKLEYRLALTNGVHGSDKDPRNPHDWPRLTGRITLNLFDADGQPGVGGFFYDGLYLQKTDAGVISPKKFLSFGVSADWQKDLNVDVDQSGAVTGRKDYLAFAGDVFWDLPLNEEKTLGLAGQADFFYYDHGDRNTSFYATDTKYATEYTGYGLAAEAGLRYQEYEFLVSLDWFEATKSDANKGDLLAVYGGLNFWWYALNCNLKLQAGASKVSGGDFGFTALLQAQLLL